MVSVHDVIVIGAGPTGLAAGIQAAQMKLETVIIESKSVAGGNMLGASSLANYPGFPDGVTGRELAERMTRQALDSGVALHLSEDVTDLSLNQTEKIVRTNKTSYIARALILATGSGSRGLGMKWETWFGGGVSYCVECGERYFRGNDVIVVGSVIEACEEAEVLAKMGARVCLVNHGNRIPLDEQTREKLESKDISLTEGFVGEEVGGSPPFKELRLRRLEDGSVRTLKTNIVLVVAGARPIVDVLRRAGIRTHRSGCVVTDAQGRTSIEGVFAAGGIASTVKDLVPPCVGDGSSVAIQSRLYISYILNA